MSELLTGIVFIACIGLTGLLYFEINNSFQDALDSFEQSGKRAMAQEIFLKKLTRETMKVKRKIGRKAGLKKTEARLTEATAMVLTKLGRIRIAEAEANNVNNAKDVGKRNG